MMPSGPGRANSSAFDSYCRCVNNFHTRWQFFDTILQYFDDYSLWTYVNMSLPRVWLSADSTGYPMPALPPPVATSPAQSAAGSCLSRGKQVLRAARRYMICDDCDARGYMSREVGWSWWSHCSKKLSPPWGQPKKFTCKLEVGIVAWHKWWAVCWDQVRSTCRERWGRDSPCERVEERALGTRAFMANFLPYLLASKLQSGQWQC